MKFIVYKNNSKISSFEENSNSFEILFGRSSICEIQVDDYRISREHLLFAFENNILSVKDLSESNIVFINGENSSQGILSDKDAISIFDFKIRIEDFTEKTEKKLVELSETVLLDKPSLEEVKGEAIVESIDEQPSSNDLLNSLEDSEDDFQINSDFSFSGSVLKDDSSQGDLEASSGEMISDESDTDVVTDFLNYYLKISGPQIETQNFYIAKKVIYIGRSTKKCHIVLEDDDVSSIHAKLSIEGKKVILEDLDSSNGIYLNGDKVSRAMLVKGDEFLVGSVSFLLKLENKMLSQESGRLMPVNIEEIAYEETAFSELDNVAVYDENSETVSAKPKKPMFNFSSIEPKRLMIWGVLGAALLFTFLPEETSEVAAVETERTIAEESQEKKVEEKEDVSLELGGSLSEADLENLERHYSLAKEAYKEGIFDEAIQQLDYVRLIDPEYKDTNQLLLASQEGLERLEQMKKKAEEEKARLAQIKKINELVEKAKKSLKDKNFELVQSYISQVAEIDPENDDIILIQREIELIKKAEADEKKKQEELKLAREKYINILNDTKLLYQEKQYYKAYLRSGDYLKLSNVGDSLYQEGEVLRKEILTTMNELEASLVEKANTFFQGEDYKNAYDSYREVLSINPTNREAITKVNLISSEINTRAMKVYREGLVSESISLYQDAKEKFEEVLRIAPKESKYYIKADTKLKKFYND